MADTYLAMKQADQAEAMLSHALKEAPNNAVLTIIYANVLMEQDKNKEAIKVLQRYTHDNPNDVNGWHLLSEANIHLGVSDEDLAARAEILALKANWNKAIQYYTQASQIAELGSLKQARYDARIDQLMVQRDRFFALQ
jgi:predicted Zn-dependent protease